MLYRAKLKIVTTLLLLSGTVYAVPCPFNTSVECTLQRDILNYRSAAGLKSYTSTNYDHRLSGEKNLYQADYVKPYTDNVNAPGQIKLLLKAFRDDNPEFLTGEIITRINPKEAPFKGANDIVPWTTKEAKHGYIEVRVKLPRCETSLDDKCQNNSGDLSYNKGLWPAIWMMPTRDNVWPDDGEIDIMEAYPANNPIFNMSTSYLHFKGQNDACPFNDCEGAGFFLSVASTNEKPLFADFHTWGFEWQPDPKSTAGGQLISLYFDNRKTAGPIATDSLPADGKAALSRGFNNPKGGYYLIVNLAAKGPYAGDTHPQLDTSAMYVQSIKAYSIADSGSGGGSTGGGTGGGGSTGGGTGGGSTGGGTTVSTCSVPAVIQQMVSSDRKTITFAWEAPKTSAAVTGYRINNWQHSKLWEANDAAMRYYQDQTLPGSVASFTYYFQAVCGNQVSSELQYSAKVN